MTTILTPYQDFMESLKSTDQIGLKNEFKEIFLDEYVLQKHQSQLEHKFQMSKSLPSGYFYYLSFPESKNDKFPVVLAIDNSSDNIVTCINLNYLDFKNKKILLDLYTRFFGGSLMLSQKELQNEKISPDIKFTFQNNYEGIKYIIKQMNTNKETINSIRKYDFKKVNKIKLFKIEHLKYLFAYDILELTKK